MAMTAKSADSDVMAELNITPLIDVMLVLLVLLLITLPIQTHAVKIDLGEHFGPPPPPVTDVGVEFDGTIVLNGRTVTRESLNSYFAKASRQNPQPEIHIAADRLARYDTVAKVLSDAQRLGVKTMGIVNTNQYIR